MALQSAAIPYRYDANGEIQIMLVTSRRKGRWVIPKGNVRLGMGAHSSAAKEAFEEAGVIGKIEPTPIASYTRQKMQGEAATDVRTDIYLMEVTTEAPVWPEMHERERRWTSMPEALALVSHKGMRRALEIFSYADVRPE